MVQRVIATLCFLFLFAASAGAENWYQWRGPRQDGIAEVKNLPVEWGNKSNIAWKAALPGPGSSQPVVWGKKVFVTSFSGYNPAGGSDEESWEKGAHEDLRFHVSCLDADNGEMLWSRELESMNPIIQQAKNVKYHGMATHTPVADEERIYGYFGPGGLFAFDHDGNEVWRTSTGEKFAGWGSAASPILHGDRLFVNASVESGALLAIDRNTGEEIWRQEAGMDFEKTQKAWYNRSWSTPLVFQVDGKWRLALLVVGQNMNVYDPETGDVLWRQPRVSGGYACNTPILDPAKDTLYCFAGGSHGTVTASAIVAADTAKDRLIWQHEERGAALIPPVLYYGRLYYGAYGGMRPQRTSCFGCLDPATGEVIYEMRPEQLNQQSRVYATTFAGDDKVYIQTGKHGTWVLDATTPEYRVLSVNILDDEKSAIAMAGRPDEYANLFNAAPAPLGDGRLILRSYWGVHCIEAAE
jgi:outer membrane protein assembly factor BamB